MMGLFALQKGLFMFINHSYGGTFRIADLVDVVWHGLRLDLVMTSYLLVVPLVVLLVSSFFKRFPLRKVLGWWYLIVALLMTLVALADSILYYYWGAKLDAADLIYVKSPKDMLASLSWWVLAVVVVAIGVLTYLQYKLLRRLTPEMVESPKNRWVSPLVALLLLALSCVGMRGGVSESTANPSYAYYSQTPYLNHAALNPMFNFIHSLSKSEDLAHEMQFFSQDKVQQLTDNVFKSSADISDTLLTDGRPNIILLVWEGGGSLMSENEQVAPNFVQLKKEGVFFSNLYANNFRTDRGLVSLLNGIPGLPTTSLMKMSGRCGNLPSLAKSLKTEGYMSGFFYGGDINFTNMRGYLFETGYTQVLGMNDFNSPVTSKWGIDDQYILSIDHLAQLEQPFFATFLTLSSHEPWEVPYSKLEDQQANSFAYADSCIAQFVQQLKHSALWSNLLLIIVPDHGVACQGHIPQDVDVARIPMLWLGGAVKSPKQISVMMNQSDIAATLLAQLGLDASQFSFSRNVLSSSYALTVVMHAYKNGLNIIDSLGSSRFDVVNGQLVPVFTPHRSDAETLTQALLQRVYSNAAKL